MKSPDPQLMQGLGQALNMVAVQRVVTELQLIVNDFVFDRQVVFDPMVFKQGLLLKLFKLIQS